MGMFEDYADIDGTAIDYSIANGVYPMTITGAKFIDHSKKPGVQQFQITYTVDPEVEDFGGKTVSEFFDLDPALPENRKAWLKRRFVSLGFDDEAVRTLEPDELIGIDVTVTVINKPGPDRTYTNVKSVVLGNDADSYAANNALGNF